MQFHFFTYKNYLENIHRLLNFKWSKISKRNLGLKKDAPK